MDLNQKKRSIKSLIYLTNVVISILLAILIWNIYIGILFRVSPGLHCKTVVNEDITWDIYTYEPTETYSGVIYIEFNVKYEIWINTPLPFFHSFDGCHLRPEAEVILTNTSISNETRSSSFGCFLAIVPALYTPGIKHKSGMVYFYIITNYTNIPGLPEGLYTFWVDFGDRDPYLESYKTYLNVSEDGTMIYSDEAVDYIAWLWGGLITSTAIITEGVFMIFIGLVYKDKKTISLK